MNILKDEKGSKAILHLSGRLDTVTAPQLQEELLPLFDSSNDVELDFSGLKYVSSAGLRVLIMGEKAAKAKNGVMTLTGVSQEVLEVLRMTGLQAILKIR